MELSQQFIGPVHVADCTLDLVFSTGQKENDLKLGDIDTSQMSDHFLLRFRFSALLLLCKGGGGV